LAAFRRAPRGRQIALATAALGTFYIGTRVLLRQLLLALLYHPFRYEDDPEHDQMRKHYAEGFRRRGYHIQEIGYSLPTQWLQGSEQAQQALLVQPTTVRRPVAGLWVVFGGNAMVGTDWLHFCYQLLSDLPQDSAQPAFLLIDYPGYGANAGAPTPQKVFVASVAAVRSSLKYFREPPVQLHLLGHSLGAAAAARLAASCSDAAETAPGPLHPLQPGRLVLSAPFTNIESMAQVFCRQITRGSAPAAWFLRHFVTHRWDNMNWVPQAASIGWDVSIIHGSRDEIVPSRMGKALKDAVEGAGYPCKFLEIRGGGHNNMISNAYPIYGELMGLPSVRRGNAAL